MTQRSPTIAACKEYLHLYHFQMWPSVVTMITLWPTVISNKPVNQITSIVFIWVFCVGCGIQRRFSTITERGYWIK